MTKSARLRTSRLTAFAAGLSALVTACSSPPKQAETSAPATAQAREAQHYDLKGRVVSVDKTGKTLTVDHEAIPGFMGAMTMAYPVKDAQLLDGLSPGDQVTAKVVSTGTEFWLENVSKAGATTSAR
jgi:Cu/Ag efflux protein CusF